MASLIKSAGRKRKPLRLPKVKDRRPEGGRLHDREQRIERTRLLEGLARHAAETRDAGP